MPAFKIFQLDTPYQEDDLRKLRFEQSADVMVLACYGYPLKRLRRFGHFDWRLDDAAIGAQIAPPVGVSASANDPQSGAADFVASVKYYVVTALNAAGQESPPSTGTNAVNDLSLKGDHNLITWTPQTEAVSYRVYEERTGIFGFLGEAVAGFPTFMDDNILAEFSNGPPQARQPFLTENPSCVAFHEARLFCGRLPTLPSAIYGSKTDDIFNFDVSRPVQATDSIALNLRARRVNAIQHLISLGGLIALTNDAIFSITPTQDGYLSPISLQSKAEGYQGCGPARPEVIVDVLFYTTARGHGIRTLGYTFEKDGYRGSDLTVFAPHFFARRKITHVVWCEEPSRVLWCVRDDGKLAALTWQAEQDVWGWTLCDTDGRVESACSVSENGMDTLYMVVNRTTDGEAPIRYIERLTRPDWIDEGWEAQADAVVMDCSVTYRGLATKRLTRLFHLEGRQVSVLADGLVMRGHSVVDGVLTPALESAASVIHVGLAYFSYIRSLPIVAQVQGLGSTKGRKQIVTNAVVEVMNTGGLEIGIGTERAPDKLYDANLPIRSDVTPRPLYTGFFDTQGFANGDWSEALVTIAQRDPLPMVILGVSPDIDVGS